MIDYQGKLAGVSLREGHLHYVVTDSGKPKLRVASYGRVVLSDLGDNCQQLHGCKIICGINQQQYSQKTVKTIAGAIKDDPDQLLWELSRSFTEDVKDYFLSFLRLGGAADLEAVESFAIRKQTFTEFGGLLERNGLVLHKLVFEPEVLRLMCRNAISQQRTAVILVEPTSACLQVYANGQLLSARTHYPVDSRTSAGRNRLVEDISVMILSTPAGKVTNRELELVLIGDDARREVGSLLSRSLPYNCRIREISAGDYEFDSSTEFVAAFDSYYLPFSLAYLYNMSQVCESSPVTEEAWC